MAGNRLETGIGVFKPPDRKVGHSRMRTVYGYEDQELVIKVPETGKKGVGTINMAMSEIGDYENARKLIASLVEANGGRSDVVVKQTAVIHDPKDDGGVSYSRVQRWYPDAKPLAEMGVNILDLPRQSLIDLRSIFIANLRIYREKGAFLDLVGSTISKRPKISKIVKHLFPIFYSENIVIDKDDVPRLIDLGSLNNVKADNLATKIRCVLQVLGSEMSLAILNIRLATSNQTP